MFRGSRVITVSLRYELRRGAEEPSRSIEQGKGWILVRFLIYGMNKAAKVLVRKQDEGAILAEPWTSHYRNSCTK